MALDFLDGGNYNLQENQTLSGLDNNLLIIKEIGWPDPILIDSGWKYLTGKSPDDNFKQEMGRPDN